MKLYQLAKRIGGKDAKKIEVDIIYNKIKHLHKKIKSIQDNSFNFSSFDESEKSVLLEELYMIRESEEDFFHSIKNKLYPNRKMMGNLAKEDIEVQLQEFVDYFIEKGYVGSNTTDLEKISRNDLNAALNQHASKIRQLLRDTGSPLGERYEDAYKMLVRHGEYSEKLILKGKRSGLQTIKQELLVLSLMEMNYSYLFMQCIVYGIMQNSSLIQSQKNYYLEQVYELIERIDNDKSWKKEAENINILHSFATFIHKLERRNELSTLINIFGILEKEMTKQPDLLSDVPEQYTCKSRYIKEIDTKKQLIFIILEGKEEKVERFNIKYEACERTIRFLRKHSGRQLYETYLQHIKVVYREIYVSKVKFNGKTAATVIRNLPNGESPFLSSFVKDSVFLREKISRGMARELGFAKAYLMKNKIELRFYKFIMELYDGKDSAVVLRNIKEAFSQLSKGMLNIIQSIER